MTLSLLLVLLLAPTVHAQPTAPEPSPVPTAWVTHVEPNHGFAITLPPSHHVRSSGLIWYVYAELDGEPLTPDMSLTFVPDADAAEVAAERFADGVVTPVESVNGTVLLKVESTYQDAAGVSRSTYRFLAQGPDGVMILARWEDLDWPPFDEVTSLFQFVVLIPQAE